MSYGSFGQLGQPTDAQIDEAIQFGPLSDRDQRRAEHELRMQNRSLLQRLAPPGSGVGLAMIPIMVGGVLILSTFVVSPAIVGAFKPKWKYGRRVLAGMGVTTAAGIVTRIAKGGR